jgi:hypothetical protein
VPAVPPPLSLPPPPPPQPVKTDKREIIAKIVKDRVLNFISFLLVRCKKCSDQDEALKKD